MVEIREGRFIESPIRFSIPRSSVAPHAGFLCFWASVAAEAFCGIEPSVNAVAGQIISPVGHQAPGVTMVFERRFQGCAGAVAVTAKRRPVTHGADLLAVDGLQAVAFTEQRRMFIAPERKSAVFRYVAGRTAAQVSVFIGVFEGQPPPLAPCGLDQ